MPDIERDERIELDYGVVLQSSNVSGHIASVRRWYETAGTVREAAPVALPEQLAADNVPTEAAQLLGTLAQEAGMRPILTLTLTDLSVAARPDGQQRGDANPPYLEVEVPAPGEDEGQVVLETDATGLVRWVVSETAAQGQGTDRADAVQTFRISVAEFDVGTTIEQNRGWTGFGVRKVIHLLRFPIERAAGRVAEFAMGRWENQHRPYGLRLTSPGNFLDPTAGEPVTAGRLAELADRPFLLFVHGIFSRCHTGFHGIGEDLDLLGELHRRYQDRVLVFDHPTVHVDPADNVRWLLSQLPADRTLTLDLVTHSRGGLVARQLGQPTFARDGGPPVPAIRTLIHVATPNSGTVLADRKRLGDLLDVCTNLLSLFPDEVVSSSLEVILEVVKHCATGVLHGLGGVAAMDPASPTLKELNSAAVPKGGRVHAMTSDFKPAEEAGVAIRALNVLVDSLFGTKNDLVVPTEGVHRAGSYVVTDPLVIPSTSAVAHTHFFRKAQVRRQLARWLPED
ncbi:esterase/lipase family protein [Streptomyces sp. NBC_01296]|uniref:esterase/lipase family protein n=1 Tax=Streptomyces sp. NBC_01296 TaxID=2903816 RepID=UPI002E0D8258|nr:hypothetical protein OG299_07915 [Streptomyces sp. NBC_01296]